MKSYKIIYLKPLTEEESIDEVVFLKKGHIVYNIYQKEKSNDYVIEIHAEGKIDRIVDHSFTHEMHFYTNPKYNYFKKISEKQANKVKDRPAYKIYANSHNIILFSQNVNATLGDQMDIPLEDIISHEYGIKPRKMPLQKIISLFKPSNHS